MLLALMDEAYTGSAIEDRGGDSGSDDNNGIDVSDPVFLDFLKDENDGITVSYYPSTSSICGQRQSKLAYHHQPI